MKAIIALCVLFFAALALARPEDEKYTDRYDTIDLKQVLGNPTLVNAYCECILEKGKCTPDGKELRGHIKEALENNCGKCTDVQKEGSRTVIKHLINHAEACWAELRTKYDPEMKYTTKYEKELREVQA